MFRSEYADVPAVSLPIHDAVLGRAAEFGELPALIDGTGGDGALTLTYGQVDAIHRRVAAGLAEAGVRKGDVLALHSPNTVLFPVAFYAATRAGASVTTVHPLATPEEFAKQLRDCAARWIVTVSPLLATARAAAELAGGVEEIFVCDKPAAPESTATAPDAGATASEAGATASAPGVAPVAGARGGPDAAGPDAAGPDAAGPDAAGPDAAGPDAAGPDAAGPDAAGPHAGGAATPVRSLQDFLGSTAPEPAPAIDPDTDVAALPYSSGTTGIPKGVMLTHTSIATNLAQLEPLMPMAPGDRILAVLPFFHVYGLTALMNGPLRRGATVVVLPRFELDGFLAAIEEHRINALYVAPPIVLALAKHPAVADYDLSSLRYIVCSAAPLDAALAEACSARLGLPPILQAYGMTELSPATHLVPLATENPPPGTVGKLLPGTEMRLVSLDDPAKDVPPGEDGEIAIRGPQVMKGYLGRPDATAAMIDEDGWLHTGDVGRVDEDGWLYVVDRVKELIKYKGFQVPPAELEALLLTHDGIADAAVIGVVDGDGAEVPKAFVVRQAAAPGLTAEQVMAYVAERVAPYKKIRRVEFVATVPRAASGKILRRELRDRT
ncbi:AMP-binding protein [Streptomyces roseicoloratus]|uniref:AMP-binding protein n=1 Tax=Streptomyces roseicoloratus TaxID=2508722 RepID=A0ABY9S3I2_9ACTN|nr:AMP-binding protein [Streptomyces roseicoloratus]WMX48875.1 AMP-binding protein [Streptomyces roseicoloratus]